MRERAVGVARPRVRGRAGVRGGVVGRRGEHRLVLRDGGPARAPARRQHAREREAGAPAARRLAQRSLVLRGGVAAGRRVGREEVGVLDPRLGRLPERERVDVRLARVRAPARASERARPAEK
jgi:hypothetical protein